MLPTSLELEFKNAVNSSRKKTEYNYAENVGLVWCEQFHFHSNLISVRFSSRMIYRLEKV